MPASEEILRGLAEIANGWRGLAILWHVYFGAFLTFLLLGKRPRRATTAALLALPLLSVSALAWSAANPLNGIVFAAFGLGALAIAAKLPSRSVEIAPLSLAVPGGLLFLFGWAYPHFLETPTSVAYLYAAPTGLLPCPTLSIVIGLTLLLGGLGSGAWLLLLGAAGSLYGLIGAIRLGVTIDGVLLAGAAACFLARLAR